MPYNSQQVSLLQAERTADPLSRGYSGMTDEQFLASVTAEDIAVPNLVNAAEVFNAYVGSELPARSSDEWQNLILLGSMNSGNLFYLEGNILAVLTAVFGPGTTTRSNLTALSTRNIARVEQIGLPVPSLADVQRTN